MATLTPTQISLIAAANSTIDIVPPHDINLPRTTDHTCAAAALASDGRIFTGINMFHYSSALCAENTVFTNAAAAGVSSAFNPGFAVDGAEKPAELVLIVAVLSEGRGVISPCGRCRQVMADYYPGIQVIVKDGEELRVAKVAELLPFAWVPKRW
jgi:cytidine deaminase